MNSMIVVGSAPVRNPGAESRGAAAQVGFFRPPDPGAKQRAVEFRAADIRKSDASDGLLRYLP
jgi:hypothetical protein